MMIILHFFNGFSRLSRYLLANNNFSAISGNIYGDLSLQKEFRANLFQILVICNLENDWKRMEMTINDGVRFMEYENNG